MQEDLTIVTLAQRGDREAFAQLLATHYSMIHRVSYRFSGSQADAEDITQEVCMALVDKLASFKGGSSFTTWLYRVVVNQCHDFRKKRNAGGVREQAYVEMVALGEAEAREAHTKTAWLYRMIAALKPPLPETALLVLAEEMSHAQAAQVLNCKESTVSWRMGEIRKQLTIYPSV